MGATGINHVGLTVTSVARSLRFYCDVVGFEQVSRHEVAGDWFDTLTRNEGARLDVAMVALGGLVLQLVEYTAAGGAALSLAHHHVGNPHLSVDVDDLDTRHAALAQVPELGVTPIVDIMGSGIRSFYVHDPDGVPVEFIQMPPRSRGY